MVHPFVSMAVTSNNVIFHIDVNLDVSNIIKVKYEVGLERDEFSRHFEKNAEYRPEV